MYHAAQGPSASTRPPAPLSATPSNGTEGSVCSSLMLLEAISRDATCSLRQVVKKCEWETNKGAIIAIVCVFVCVCACVCWYPHWVWLYTCILRLRRRRRRAARVLYDDDNGLLGRTGEFVRELLLLPVRGKPDVMVILRVPRSERVRQQRHK